MSTSTTSPSSFEELNRHAAFVRALALGILKDEHLSDDVVQQVFVQALLHPPSDRGALRSWLARVTRRMALNVSRGESRRRRRERLAARVEAFDADAGVELSVQRVVLDAVAALHEPYRTAIHLRYYRGWTPSRIARELDLPTRTVEGRLTRAHRILREKLGRLRRDDRLTWAVMALPRSGAGLKARILGGLLMTKNGVLVGAAALAVGGAWIAWRVAAPAERPHALPSPAVVSEAEVEPPGSVPGVARETSTERRTAQASEPAAIPQASSEASELEAAMDDLLATVERSLGGSLDPGAVLDAALLLATHETGPAVPEPSPGGAITYPLLDLPDGVEAELQVRGKNQRQESVLALRMRLQEPRESWLVEGLPYREPEVEVATWTDEEGELRHFSISTGAQPGGGFPFADAAEIRSGVLLHTPMDAPSEWKLNMGGMKPVEDAADEPGERSWRSGQWEIPQVLDGGPWPRVDDMNRLGELLRARYDEIRARSDR